MKKILAFLIFIALVLSVSLAFGCQQKGDTVFSYYRTAVENGESVQYVLTVDEKNGTFSIRQENSQEITYSGTFYYSNGYLVLTSRENQTEYVRLSGDTYEYITISPDPQEECEHEYELTESSAGDCRTQGYEKYVCSKCGHEETRSTPYGAHNYTATSFTAGTCKEKSVTVYTCSVCGDVQRREGNYGDHAYGAEATSDTGCTNKIKIVRRCSLCGNVEEKETETYGHHLRDENGVCTVCGFDEIGICRQHTDENDDGICDDCLLSVAVMQSFHQNGYVVSGDLLYFGAYPQQESTVPSETLLSEGKTDPDTGYIRYQKASYKLAEKNGVTKAFLVQPIVWKKLSENEGSATYICQCILDRTVFLDRTKQKVVWQTVEEEGVPVSKPYYYYAPTYEENPVCANDFSHSDLFAYANGEFIRRALLNTQRALITPSADVVVPSSETAETESILPSDYVKFIGTGGSYSEYFTSTPSTGSDSVVTESGLLGADESPVWTERGFVPMITVTLP